MGLASWLGRLTDFWEAAQVELHGFYSAERVCEYNIYYQKTSKLRALLILVIVPWPCVIITILVDLIPLRPPSEGLDANYLFVLRIFLSFLVASTVVNLQFRHSIPAVSLPNWKVLITSTITAIQTTGVLYGLSRAVGFPLPFGIITVSPAWVAFLLLPLASFLRRARANPELWPLVMNSLKVWVCQESLVVIYPTYFYIFTTLSTKAKTPFAFLLPIIKMLLRNLMSRTVVHLNDEIPEVVLMNVEVFNSLFMSYCMQNTPSIYTTLGLIAIDGAQMIASVYDVEKVIYRMEIVRNRVLFEQAQHRGDNITITFDAVRKGTILGYTQDILERHNFVQPKQLASTFVGPSSTQVLPFDAKVPAKRLSKQTALKKIKPKFSLRQIFPSGKADVTTLELDYALNVRKVLYITEFVILINYVEVIVPMIFSANLIVMYHLPNRVYYSQIVTMDDEKLWDTLANVTLYCFLQLVSLVILFFCFVASTANFWTSTTGVCPGKTGRTGTDEAGIVGLLQRTSYVAAFCFRLQLQVRVATWHRHIIVKKIQTLSQLCAIFLPSNVIGELEVLIRSRDSNKPKRFRSNDHCSVETTCTKAGKAAITTQHPCTLSWSNLTYTVDSKKGKKTILTNVTGRCAPGELTAIMGPSGCGKTTLLDILADRICSGTIKGEIALNGEKRTEKTFRAVSSYVAQEDSLLGSFTVLETLRMAAKLTMPNCTSAISLLKRVQSVIDDMGLRVCENAMVGDMFHKGISGGQKRRLSIAIEMLSDPSILLLDEPTSGLDSASTYNVIKLISRLSHEGRTILCTIHQPSSLVYEMFANVVILTAGRTVFFGPRKKILLHFSFLGYDCPQYQDPAEYFIDLANTDFEGHGDIEKLVNGYASSAIASRVVSAIRTDASGVHALRSMKFAKVSPTRQFFVLLHRNLLNNLRNPGIYWIRLVTYTVLSFMVGTMYLSSNPKIIATDIVMLLTYVNIYLVFLSIAVLPFFVEQRSVFLRERTNSGVNVLSYVAANFLGALPGIFLIALSSTMLVGYLAGLNSYAVFLLTVFLSLIVAESLMHLISVVVPQFIIGMALGAAIFGWFILVMGLFVPGPAMPNYWRWSRRLGFLSYSFEVLLYNQFSVDDSPQSQAVLAKFRCDEVHIGKDMAILAANAVVFEVAFAAILYKFHTGRR